MSGKRCCSCGKIGTLVWTHMIASDGQEEKKEKKKGPTGGVKSRLADPSDQMSVELGRLLALVTFGEMGRGD